MDSSRDPSRKVYEALRVLGLDFRPSGDFDADVKTFGKLQAQAKRRRRELARTLHPDVGGDAERMKDVNAAVDLLQKVRLVRPQPEPRITIIMGTGGSGTTWTHWY